MGRKKKLGLTIFSLLLWAQLVFSVGITVWRYWLVGTGGAELFVAESAQQVEPLLGAVDDQCPAGSYLIYFGDEAAYYYARYQLYPRSLTWSRFEREVANESILENFVSDFLAEVDSDACLLFDYLPSTPLTMGERLLVNGEQVLYVVSK